MLLRDILWPIYPLPNKAEFKDYNGLKLIRPLSSESFLVLDAPKIEESTIGRRRLKFSSAPNLENFKLFNLSVPIHRYSDIFFYIDKYKSYVDSSGRVFNYIREKYYPLKYHQIKKFQEVDEGYLVFVRDIHMPFFINREPLLEETYAGILHIGRGYVLYSIEATKLADTRRMI